MILFFFFKQKTAYEMRVSDWSSDVCSSDLPERRAACRALSRTSGRTPFTFHGTPNFMRSPAFRTDGDAFRTPEFRPALEKGNARSCPGERLFNQIGRASCRERVCQYV